MKVLIIIAILLVAHGNSSSSSLLIGKRTIPNDNLRKVAKKIVDNIKLLKDGIDDIEKKVELVLVELSESKDIFLTIWYEDESVQKIKAMIRNIAETGKNTSECNKIFDRELHLISSVAYQELAQSFEENKNNLIKTFELMKMQLDDINDNLKNKLENNLELCIKDSANCKITGQYIEETENIFSVTDRMQQQLPQLVQFTLSMIPPIIPLVIEHNLLPLITKCLETE